MLAGVATFDTEPSASSCQWRCGLGASGSATRTASSGIATVASRTTTLVAGSRRRNRTLHACDVDFSGLCIEGGSQRDVTRRRVADANDDASRCRAVHLLERRLDRTPLHSQRPALPLAPPAQTPA
eukprot:2678161-Rhodomonas_salina.2